MSIFIPVSTTLAKCAADFRKRRIVLPEFDRAVSLPRMSVHESSGDLAQ